MCIYFNSLFNFALQWEQLFSRRPSLSMLPSPRTSYNQFLDVFLYCNSYFLAFKFTHMARRKNAIFRTDIFETQCLLFISKITNAWATAALTSLYMTHMWHKFYVTHMVQLVHIHHGPTSTAHSQRTDWITQGLCMYK